MEEIITSNAEETADRIDEVITTNPGNGDLEPLVSYCFELYKQFGGGKGATMSEYRKSKLDEIKEATKVYDQIATPKSFPWDGCSNIVLPLTMITVDNLEPRLVAGLSGADPPVTFEMRGSTDSTDVMKSIQEWWNQELKDVIGLEKLTMSIVHSLLIEGTVYVYPRYILETGTVADFVFDEQTGAVKIGEDGTPVVSEEETVLFEGGRAEMIPFHKVYCADDVGTQDEWDAADKIIEVEYTYADLMRRNGSNGWKNIGPWLIPEKKKRRKQRDEVSPAQSIAGVEVTGKEVIECLECHISFPIGQNLQLSEDQQRDFKEEFLVVTITKSSRTIINLRRRVDLYMANKSILKRVRMFPEPKRSFGTGMYGKMKAVQGGASDIFNRMIDAALVILIPWFFFDERSGLSGEMDLYPGKGVEVASVEGIKFPTFNINAAHYLTFLQFLVTLWERIGSVGDWQIGVPTKSSGRRTKAEVQNVLQEGAIKHNYQARTTKDEYLSIIEVLYDLYYQYMPAKKTFMYNGQETVIPRKEMKRGYRFTLRGSTDLASKAAVRQDALQLWQIASKDPLFNPIPVREELLKSFGKHEWQKYLDPKIMQMIQVLLQNPEIMEQVIRPYLQTKAEVVKNVAG